MTEEKPRFEREIEEILRRDDYIEARGRDDFPAPKVSVSRKTRERFLNFLEEMASEAEKDNREAALFIKEQILAKKLKLLKAPEIIYHDDGTNMYVQLGAGIYLWDEDGGSKIPKEQLIEVTRAACALLNKEWPPKRESALGV